MQAPELAGRCALITGGGGAIGMAVARALAADGVRVALADIRPEAAGSAAAQLAQEGAEAVGLVGDVGDPDAAEALVTGTLDAFGSLDILVNNAGFMGRTAPLWELSDEDWHSVIRVNLSSVFYVSRAAIRPMREQGRGAIVSVASIAGKEGTPNLIPYTVTKAGIIAFTWARR